MNSSKKTIVVVLVAAVGAFSGFVVYVATAIQPHFKDVTYGEDSDRNVLDVYLSTTTIELQPLIVLVHGGGFKAGDKARPRFLEDFLEAGFAVAAINYRLSDEATWPAQLTDVTRAVRFLHDKAADFGIDPERIAIFGQSAGGHLTATSTLSLAANDANIVRAAVVWFGPVDFSMMDADMAESGQGTSDTNGPSSPESQLIGAPVGEHPALARAASPLHFIAALPDEALLPPVLIMHGARDPLIAARQSQRLHDAIAASPASSEVELQILPEGTHGGGAFREPAAIGAVIEFVSDNLALSR